MKEIELFLFDTNLYSLEGLTELLNLTKSDFLLVENYKKEETKKEKLVSNFFKRKFVGDYYLNEYNKPVSNDIFFNISHSNGVVIFSKSDVEIGIDIEKIKPINKDRFLKYLTSKEIEYIYNDADFFKVWTFKEALFKCIGNGVSSEFKKIEFSSHDKVFFFKSSSYTYNQQILNDYVITVVCKSKEKINIKLKQI